MFDLNLKFKWIIHGSTEYDETVQLRDDVLRKPLGLSFTEEQLASEKDSHHLAGYINGDVVCCLILKEFKEPKRSFKMRQVAVRDDMQGLGLGKAMDKECAKICNKRAIRRIFCHAREIAVPFYEKLGYKIYDEPFEEIGIPHRKMEKSV